MRNGMFDAFPVLQHSWDLLLQKTMAVTVGEHRFIMREGDDYN
jgi:hypothetical protein